MRRIDLFATLAFGLFTVLLAIDQIKADDAWDATNFALDVFEKAMLALAVVATAYIALETRGMKRERIDLLNDLSRVRSESDRWRSAARVHVEGLGRAISEQFKLWKLSDGEADIAMLMLKGLTQKEIAHLRGSEDGTVRQQAAAVYRKSGLSNRSELGAFFLEDLLSPNPGAATQTSQKLELVRTLGRDQDSR